MQSLIFLSLVVSLILIVLYLSPFRINNKSRLIKLGIITYVIFTSLAAFFNFMKDDPVKVSKIDIDLERKGEAEEKEEQEAPIGFKWETEFSSNSSNKLLFLKLTITNNLGREIKSLKMKFTDKPIQEYFSVSEVNPAVNIDGNIIGFGSIEKEEETEFIFELVPKGGGMYEEEVIPLVNGEEILTNKGKLTSRLQINSNGNN